MSLKLPMPLFPQALDIPTPHTPPQVMSVNLDVKSVTLYCMWNSPCLYLAWLITTSQDLSPYD